MPATEIAQVPGVHLEGGGPLRGPGKVHDVRGSTANGSTPCRLPDAGPDLPNLVSLIPATISSANSIPPLAYMESFSAIFRICTPCTRDAPPRIAAATWTASVISARFDPFSRHARV